MQEIFVIIIAVAATIYLVQRLYKSLFTKKTGCDVSCGCDSSAKSPILEQLRK